MISTSPRDSERRPVPTVSVSTVPSGRSTCTRVEPSAPAESAARGTANTAPSVDSNGSVTRRFWLSASSGTSSMGSSRTA